MPVHRKTSSTLTGMSYLTATLSLLLFGGILLYSFAINTSHHTGFNPYLALVLFIPTALLGVFQILVVSAESKWPGLMALLVGLAGVALLIYLDQSNQLLPYEVWIRRGMP